MKKHSTEPLDLFFILYHDDDEMEMHRTLLLAISVLPKVKSNQNKTKPKPKAAAAAEKKTILVHMTISTLTIIICIRTFRLLCAKWERKNSANKNLNKINVVAQPTNNEI